VVVLCSAAMARRYAISDPAGDRRHTAIYCSELKGSELVIEHILPPHRWMPDEQPFLKQIVEAAKEIGEPWLTYFTSQELSDHLRAILASVMLRF
jgi:hypothetical protein